MSEQTPEPLLVVPEQFLPTQLAPPRHDSLVCGEKALMLAVLEDAIRCLDRRSRSGARLAREAEAWIRANDTRWPFSFVNVCAHLEIDASRLRAALLGGAAARSVGAGYRLHLRLKPRRARLRVRADPRAVQIVESSRASSRESPSELPRELPRRAAQG
jgi:hypothetical protein